MQPGYEHRQPLVHQVTGIESPWLSERPMQAPSVSLGWMPPPPSI